MGRNLCSVFKCRQGYKWNHKYDSNRRLTVFQFPQDENEKQLWIATLPNSGLSVDNITNNMGVCELHWPNNYPTKKSRRWEIPANPPSVFDVPASCSRQTAPTKLRKVGKRLISAEARATAAEKRHLKSALESDQIRSWDNLISYCQSLDLLNHENPSGIVIFCLYHPQNQHQPSSISFSINITSDFKVLCFKNQTKVPIRDILGYTCVLKRFSQLKSIIDFVSNFQPTFHGEFVSISERIRQICETISDEDQKRRVLFLARQLELCSYSQNGRRYSTSDFKSAIELFLRSRNCYQALRYILVLPLPKTIKSLFGKLSDPGSIQECQEVVKSVFSNLDGPQKYCKILLDEVYIKPSIRYYGNHIIGQAIDANKPARTMLTLMVCPIFGAPAFVARIIPIYYISTDLIYQQVTTLVKIIHDSFGLVFLIMTDNLRANVKFFKMLHANYGSVNDYSIKHPVQNDVFFCALPAI